MLAAITLSTLAYVAAGLVLAPIWCWIVAGRANCRDTLSFKTFREGKLLYQGGYFYTRRSYWWWGYFLSVLLWPVAYLTIGIFFFISHLFSGLTRIILRALP